MPSTSATSGEAAHTGSDSEDEVEASFKAAAERLRLQRQEEQMPIEDRLNMYDSLNKYSVNAQAPMVVHVQSDYSAAR